MVPTKPEREKTKEIKMDTYKATFRNDDSGRTKSYKVKAPGIIPAVDDAFHKALADNHLFGYTLIKIEMVNK